jgi:hypothetical protein
LLSFYLKGLDRWHMDKYLRKGQEIRAKGPGMIWADEQQAIAYERAALNCGLERIRFIERLTADAKTEGWTRKTNQDR